MPILQFLIPYIDDKPMTLIYGLISGASGSVSDILAAGTEFYKTHSTVNRAFTTFRMALSTFVPTLIGCKLMGLKSALSSDELLLII